MSFRADLLQKIFADFGEESPMSLRVSQSDRRRDSDILPSDDGVPMETAQHRVQMNLLIDTLKPYLAARSIPAFVGGNMFLYYQKSAHKGKQPKFCGPDFFVALGREEDDKKSYVVWEEDHHFPDVIVELLSESTESVDRGGKFILYRDLFRTPEYYLYDPLSQRFEGYCLKNGSYEPIPAVRGVLRCQMLDLQLAVRGKWLRWLDKDGFVLPTGEERAEQEAERAEHEAERAEQERTRAEQERTRAEQERTRAEQERMRADRLALKLREVGIDPDL